MSVRTVLRRLHDYARRNVPATVRQRAKPVLVYSDPIASISGVSSTAQLGTVTTGPTRALTGVSSTTAIGTVGLARTVALTGVQSVPAIGSVGLAVPDTVTLGGLVSTPEIGTVIASSSVALTGVSSTAALGTVTVSTTTSVAPANGSAATAIAITILPYTTTQDMTSGGITYDVWYSYQAQPGDNVIGVFAYGDSVDFTADCRIYTGPTSSPTPYLPGAPLNALNLPMQFPVTVGEIYYILVTYSGFPLNAVLHLSVLRGPDLTLTDGAIVIPDDIDGFPVSIMDPEDGTIQGYRQPFAAGEGGDSLPSGLMCVEDVFQGGVRLYDANFTQTAWLSTLVEGRYVSSNRVDKFYLGAKSGIGPSGGFAGARVIDAVTGTSLNSWAFDALGLLGIAPSPDETILYYSGCGGTNAPIKRWDIVNDVQLSNLAPTIAGFRSFQDVLVLSTGNILAGYYPIVEANGPGFVNQYDTLGGVVRQYTLETDANADDLLCHGIDSPVSFWVWTHRAASGLSRFRNIRVTDGVVLTDFESMDFESGIYQGEETATPITRFGHSFSCPFFVMHVAPTPIPAEPVTGVRFARRRVRRFPHLNAERVRTTFSSFELLAQVGEGVAEGLGYDPQIMMRLSRDGGRTFGDEHWTTLGKMGAYQTRVRWTQLGQARDLVIEVVVSDPVNVVLVEAYLNARKGLS